LSQLAMDNTNTCLLNSSATNAPVVPLTKTIGKYLIKKTLGKGKFKVKLAVDPETNKNYAIKLYAKSIPESDIFFEREKTATSKFNHNNILKLVDCLENQTYRNTSGKALNCNVLVLELAPHGDLFDSIIKSGKYHEQLARTLFKQLVSGLEYIHNNGYVHLDLKPDNIFIDQNYNLKIADFDLAKVNESKFKGQIGTMNYMAPEILEYKEFDGKTTDIFGLGIILFSMVVGHLPFTQAKYNDPYYKYFVIENERRFWDRHEKDLGSEFFSPSFKMLMESMMAYDPKVRATFGDIKASEWFKGPMLDERELKEEMEHRWTLCEKS